MPFNRNTVYADRASPTFGEYLTTFASETGQVHADLFRQGDALVAYVWFEGGITLERVTDRFVKPLKEFAKGHGFGENFRIMYVEN